MPGRLFLTSPMAEVADWAGDDRGTSALPPQTARMNIAPGQEVVVLTADGWQMMRWGLIPVGRKNARGRPVLETIINARSETVFGKRAFEGVGRAIVPANGWYEWTGEKRKKTAWRIGPKEGDLIGFAAIYDIWNAPGGRSVAQVATVTCPPNADVQDIHHRMGVLLHPGQFAQWLGASETAAADLMLPFPDGGLQVSEAIGVDWDGP